MTFAQITAIISLLIAFNVPQVTVNNVQAILLNAKTTQTQTVASPIPPPVVVPITEPPTKISTPCTNRIVITPNLKSNGDGNYDVTLQVDAYWCTSLDGVYFTFKGDGRMINQSPTLWKTSAIPPTFTHSKLFEYLKGQIGDTYTFTANDVTSSFTITNDVCATYCN